MDRAVNNCAYPNTTNELVHAILHGNITKGFPEPPSKVVKIFISSTKTDFECERQHLHEVVVPKLERYCNNLSVDLLLIDPHWQIQPPNKPNQNDHTVSKPDLVCNGSHSVPSTNQTGSTNSAAVIVPPIIYDYNTNCINPHEFELQLKEVEECSQKSAATFFMCLIGHKYRPIALPTVIASNDFHQIFNAAAESGLGDVSLLRSCYKENRNLQPMPQYVLLEPRRASRQYEEELEHIAKLMEYGSKAAAREGLLSDRFGSVMSAVHQQTLHALQCDRVFSFGGSTGGGGGGSNAHSPTWNHFSTLHPSVNSQTTTSMRHVSNYSTSVLRSREAVSPAKSIKASTTTANDQIEQKSLNKLTSAKRPTSNTSHRLIHQASLQQVPTQQKISMPRQSSVSSNYALMQQPVERMLCFIRQFEGVNFNNACISRFFDVTPTVGDDSGSHSGVVLPTGANASLVPNSTTASTASVTSQCKQLYAPSAQNDIQQLIEDVILGLKKGNVHYFNISWSPPECNTLQTRTYTLPEHYLERFGETVLATLKRSIEQHISTSNAATGYTTTTTPTAGAGLASLDTVGTGFTYPADIVREAHSHLCNFRRVMGALGMAQAIDSDFAHLLHIRELLISSKMQDEMTSGGGASARGARHQPIVVIGSEGSGKSTLLAQVFTYAPEWLAQGSDREGVVVRIVRQCGQSPSSNFASELLRSLCIQIAIAYGLDSQLARSVAAHELSELAICFQELLKLCRTTSDLLIILDDLHHLQSALQSSALLGWMPWNLPSNVHFICSVALEVESVHSILRSRIATDNFIQLDDCLSITSNNCAPNIQPTQMMTKHPQLTKNKSIFSMIQCKLRDEKRTLTNGQWDFVRQKLNIRLSLGEEEDDDDNQNDSCGRVHETTPDIVHSHNVSRHPIHGSSMSALGTVSSENLTPLFANMLATSVLSSWESFYVPESMPTSVTQIVATILDDIEECIPYTLVRRICTYLTCTKYGLRESELYSLVQETLVNQVWPAMAISGNTTTSVTDSTSTPDPFDYPRSTASTWLLLKAKLTPLWREYYVQGRLYFNWRSPKVARAVQDRYLVDIRQIRATHQELATAFYSSFNELNTAGKPIESIREADELWYHLLYSGNKEQLKSYALLNIRFLNTIVQGVSVCYLRCILDAVRSQILDWDVEQLYGMLKQSAHVVTQDASQLAVESLLWLVPFASSGTISLNQLITNTSVTCNNSRHSIGATAQYRNGHGAPNAASCLQDFLRQAHRHCLDYKHPLLCPNNIWLRLPVPPQVTMITSPWSSITRAVTTPDSQHLIVCEGKMLHFFHLPTKTIAKSVEGHKSTITCLHLSGSSRWLATGSDDRSVNLWQLDVSLMEVNDCRLRHRFTHHVAGVLCVTINHAETLVLSGSEVGAICAVSLCGGSGGDCTLITRLEHHKGMVTCMNVNSGDDVLVSGSTDRTVVVWSLETFCILNEILLMRPVLHMDISLDSTFLLLSLDDNTLQVRALTTGTGVHTLQPSVASGGPVSVISYVRFAEDNCRCVVGYADGRLVLFDIHSARQLQTLTGHSEMISAILPQKDDHFLITCGGNKVIIWNFYPVKRVDHSGVECGGSNGSAGDKSLYDSIGYEVNSSNFVGQSSEMFAGSGGGTGFVLCPDSIQSASQSGGSGSGNSNATATNAATSSTGSSGRNSRSSSDRRKRKPNGSFRNRVRTSVSSIDHHREPITCVVVSRDGQYAVTGSRDCLVKIWYTATGETHTTLDGHSAPVTCVDMSANSQFVVSGTEDGSIRAWSLTLSMYVCTFTEHQPAPIVAVMIMSDSKRALSADSANVHRLWQVDSGVQLKCVANKPTTGLHLHGNMVFAIGGKIDNCLKYWSCFEPELEKSVSHSDTITCFTSTHRGKTLITGSQDMSLKVWEASSAKLTQVLVGHEGAITCVATAALEETLVISGAQDCNLIVWDMSTGADLFTLTGHNANVTGVMLTPDGARALSYSEDNTLQLWDIRHTGQRLSILDVHHNFVKVYSSLNLTYLAVWLGGNAHILPIIKHHNNPAHSIVVDLPPVGMPSSFMTNSGANSSAANNATNTMNFEEKSSAWLRGLVPRNATALAARTLKREQSFDSFYWDHMLHRGQSVDDFRKIGAFGGGGGSGIGVSGGVTSTLAASGISPFGSREQLWSGGNNSSGIYDGSTSTTSGSGGTGSASGSSGSSTRSRMINKLMNIGPKHKMLKKQQSMFACFPEFTGKSSQQAATTPLTPVVNTTTSGGQLSDTLATGASNGAVVGKKLTSTVTTVGAKYAPVVTNTTIGSGIRSKVIHRSGSVETGNDADNGDNGSQQWDQTNRSTLSNKSILNVVKQIDPTDTGENLNKTIQITIADSSVCVMM